MGAPAAASCRCDGGTGVSPAQVTARPFHASLDCVNQPDPRRPMPSRPGGHHPRCVHQGVTSGSPALARRRVGRDLLDFVKDEKPTITADGLAEPTGATSPRTSCVTPSRGRDTVGRDGGVAASDEPESHRGLGSDRNGLRFSSPTIPAWALASAPVPRIGHPSKRRGPSS